MLLRRLCSLKLPLRLKESDGFKIIPRKSYSSMKMLNIEKEGTASVEGENLENSFGSPVIKNERSSSELIEDQILSKAKSVPMIIKEPVLLSFDDIPGPKTLKYLSTFRHYISELGTQILASGLVMSINVGRIIQNKAITRNLTSLFDEYGPVVRFISPVGGDIVFLNNPEHIKKVYAAEGEYPVRSVLDSLEKFRIEHRQQTLKGVFSGHGEEWRKKRVALESPLQMSLCDKIGPLSDICDNFVAKISCSRNYHDEFTFDVYEELHKWSFDVLGFLVFSTRFSILAATKNNTSDSYGESDDKMLLYESMVKASKAINKCESGFQLWRMFNTPPWKSLVKHCDSLDSQLCKFIWECDAKLQGNCPDSLIGSLLAHEKLSAEEISTIVMDLFIIGVNSMTSSMSFLLFYLAKYRKCQAQLAKEIESILPITVDNLNTLQERTPYLQACIKECLRLTPPIPVTTRTLSKNIALDKFNVPRGTHIIMSMKDASLKESNFEDADKFCPERWFGSYSKTYHPFASIPFGFGARKCLGQNIAETMMTLLTAKLIENFKLEYHYGDITPTSQFIAKPNKQLKLRFIDRFLC